MSPIVISRPDGSYTIAHDIILENISKQAVEDYFCSIFREHFWDMCKPIAMQEEEYLTLTGKVLCCDCGQKVTKYNLNWKESNQRCESCK